MEEDPVVLMITTLVRGGETPQSAARMMKASGVPEGAVDRGLKLYLVEARARRGAGEANVLDAQELEDWYPGPGPQDDFWHGLRRRLLEKGWSEDAVQSVDHQSTRVVARLAAPGREAFDTKGLVLGYVQSGKTANFTAVMAKAADTGYRLFIVLSGVTNLLRTQTQVRLEGDLVDPTRSRWVMLTTKEEDFRAGNVQNINAFLADHAAHRVLCVVKKNATVLRRLLNWLRAAQAALLQQVPVLVIDDEADQASVNTGQTDEVRSVINQLVLHILHRLPKTSYVGYTATPFANVFIDPSARDLYPKDFILSLPQPEGYFGPEAIFGRERLRPDEPEQEGLDMIRRVPAEDVPLLQPRSGNARFDFRPEMAPSLEEALQYFWLATAARRARGDVSRHSTMLIHTTMYVVGHDRVGNLVEAYRQRLFQQVMAEQTGSIVESLRMLWERERRQVPPESMGEEKTTFESLYRHFPSVVLHCRTTVENVASDERLDYSFPAVQVVIGGNVLSRGLTLEGLVVSYFVRTASAYDTLLQMGRWFGYRNGYADLPRVWMTEELEQYFYDLATVEQEIRTDIRRYEIEQITPLQFGPRIRTHPAMSITARMKMQAAVWADVSYSDRRLQTILFNHRDTSWLRQNLNAARALVRGALDAGNIPEEHNGNTLILERVPVRLVMGFLDWYQFHQESVELQRATLQAYIREQNEEGELLWWRVGIVGKAAGPDTATLTVTEELEVPLLTRSRLQIGSGQYANLGAIMSKEDRVADLDLGRAEARQMDEGELQGMRPRGIGLLLLYPIDRDSAPLHIREGRRSRRMPLNAVEHVIGVGLVFPQARDLTPQRYLTVDLSGVQREEIDYVDEEAEEVE